jgi:hypothetical protein
MKFAVLFFLFISIAHAEEKVENIKTSISDVTQERENVLDIPKRIPNLNWDEDGVRLVRREKGSKQKFVVIMKGTLVKHKVESFTYQVDGNVAHPIKLAKDHFSLEIPLEKSPAIIRLWLEVSEGKAVKIYHDEVHVRSDIVPGAAEEKQINY